MRPQYYSISGTPHQRGKQWGQLIQDSVRSLIAQDNHHYFSNAVLNKKRETEWRRYQYVINTFLPETGDFLKGIVEGAECDDKSIITLQCRRELSVPSDDCSLFATINSGDGYIAQTIDLAKYNEPYGCILHESDADKRPLSIMFTLTGLAGYAGINCYGLGVGINMVRSCDWQTGIPPYLLVRHLLSLKTINECICALKKLPRASSRCLTLLQGNTLVTAEMTATRLRYWNHEKTMHTNHYIHPDFRVEDALLKTLSTDERFQRLGYLTSNASKLSKQEILQVLSDHSGIKGSLCCHGLQPMDTHTVAGIMLVPGQGKLAAIKGNPCKSN
ncbi:C45 family autoproteolytic acyltransferase/hydolase [Photorhabdus laumondii]|uniref:C45 family autoproteolytic acyltransferase/hydolase n=1 Tax=Photorhabdus laumondii TaxID=2218628 RepID=UPI0025B1F75E|nr:C45 family peptidase [Photorhabdus laumondii]